MCFLQIKFYESVKPLQIEVADLRGWNKTLEAETTKYKSDLTKAQEVREFSYIQNQNGSLKGGKNKTKKKKNMLCVFFFVSSCKKR